MARRLKVTAEGAQPTELVRRRGHDRHNQADRGHYLRVPRLRSFKKKRPTPDHERCADREVTTRADGSPPTEA
jgi:hypothetical protein